MLETRRLRCVSSLDSVVRGQEPGVCVCVGGGGGGAGRMWRIHQDFVGDNFVCGLVCGNH